VCLDSWDNVGIKFRVRYTCQRDCTESHSVVGSRRSSFVSSSWCLLTHVIAVWSIQREGLYIAWLLCESRMDICGCSVQPPCQTKVCHLWDWLFAISRRVVLRLVCSVC
jgi:hypothetical protein